MSRKRIPDDVYWERVIDELAAHGPCGIGYLAYYTEVAKPRVRRILRAAEGLGQVVCMRQPYRGLFDNRGGTSLIWRLA